MNEKLIKSVAIMAIGGVMFEAIQLTKKLINKSKEHDEVLEDAVNEK